MKDFDSDLRRRNCHRLPQTKWGSSASDENDPEYRTGLWLSAGKTSVSRRITSPAKKVLGERNGGEDMEVVSEYVEDETSLSPYDRFKSYLTPRPKFLRYRPDRRSEILTLLRDKKDEKEIDRGLSFGDEGGKYCGVESKEEEQEEGSDVMKGLIKKLAWFVLFLFSTSYLCRIDVSEVPTEGIDRHDIGFSSWPTHNFTYQAVSENEGADVDSIYGDHVFSSCQSECGYGNEVTLGKVEEKILFQFHQDHPWPVFEELPLSLIQNSRLAVDNLVNTVLLDEAHEVQLKSESGNDLSAFDSPTTERIHFDPGEIIGEKFASSKEYPKQAELETPKSQDWEIASVRGMIIFSLSAVPFLIGSSLFLGMLAKRRSSPNVFQSQVTKKLFNSQHVYHRSAELQSLKEEYQTVPRTSAAIYPKNVKNASLVPGVELLGEFTFGGHGSSPQSNSLTKLHNAIDEQSINFMSKEKSVLEASGPEFIKSPLQGRSSTFARLEVDKGTNGSTPTPLRRSSRLRNQAFQSP